MPTASQTAPKSDVAIDRASHTIRLSREIDASPAEIFDAWTRPERVTSWWDPEGQPLAACEIDLRPGGSFRFVTRSRPEMPFAGVYREIAPADRLVFEALGSTGRVMLKETGGRTRMTVEIECRSSEQLDQFLKMGVHAGTSRTLDNLLAYIRSRASRAA